MQMVLSIDPGPVDSAYTLVAVHDLRPVQFAKVDNAVLLHSVLPDLVADRHTRVVVEMIASYGMAVGAEVFDTCVWIGRYLQQVYRVTGVLPDLVKRQPVKLHHCHTSKANDSNVTRALVDRFAAGATNHGKGTKAAPGWFYGFSKDVWQAYALGVYAIDTTTPQPSI